MLRLAARGLGPVVAQPAATPTRVLLLRPDHIGDVLMTAPAIALLRASLPAASLTYVVGPWSVEAARNGPAVDSLRTLAYPGFTRRPNTNLVAPYTLLVRTAARLRRERFDLAVIFRPDHWWGALLALAAGIPLRIGGDTPETRLLLTHAQPVLHTRHATEQALSLARLTLVATGVQAVEPHAPRTFRLSDAAQTTADALWNEWRLVGRRVVAIQPSAGAVLKSWPVTRWARLADRLAERGMAVLLVGAPADLALLKEVESRVTRPLAGVACGQGLEVSAAIYQRSAVLVAPDGGAAHVAAVVGTPTVRLYGPAPVDVFGPWPPRSDQRVLIDSHLACSPCGYLEGPPCGATALPACLLALGVEDVLNAVGALLGHG